MHKAQEKKFNAFLFFYLFCLYVKIFTYIYRSKTKNNIMSKSRKQFQHNLKKAKSQNQLNRFLSVWGDGGEIDQRINRINQQTKIINK